MKSDKNINAEHPILGDLVKMHQSCEGQPDLVRFEYLFYTDLDLKGEDLADDLKKLNYEAEVDATHRKCDCTRVFGKTALLRNDEDSIRQWYSEMRDIGSYHECDFSCYSVVRNPAPDESEKEKINPEKSIAMNIDDILNNKQVVNEEKFENGNNAQEGAAPFIMDIIRNLGGDSIEELVLEFFFFTNEKSKAEDLAEALKKFGYEVHMDDTGRADLKYSITGQTIPLPNEDDVVVNWSKKMNELGYIHDCQFDGWGTAVAKGGWFSDDTPEEELRKRLGFPPAE